MLQYKWNYLDNYISNYSDMYIKPLQEDLKYWQVRLLVLPDVAQNISRFLISAEQDTEMGIYESISPESQAKYVEGFLKFMELVHHIKRPFPSRPPVKPTARVSCRDEFLFYCQKKLYCQKNYFIAKKNVIFY